MRLLLTTQREPLCLHQSSARWQISCWTTRLSLKDQYLTALIPKIKLSPVSQRKESTVSRILWTLTRLSQSKKRQSVLASTTLIVRAKIVVWCSHIWIPWMRSKMDRSSSKQISLLLLICWTQVEWHYPISPILSKWKTRGTPFKEYILSVLKSLWRMKVRTRLTNLEGTWRVIQWATS